MDIPVYGETTFDSMPVGYATFERWGSPGNYNAAFYNFKGERVVVHGESWWKLFDALKAGNTKLKLWGHADERLTFIDKDEHEVTVIGPMWKEFYKATMYEPVHAPDVVDVRHP